MNTSVHSSHGARRYRLLGPILDAHASRVERAARLALQNPTRRTLLKLLADRGRVTYRDLFDALDVSERWVRELVADLRRAGIVETPGNPAIIRLASTDMELVIKEVVQFLASEWVDAVRGRSTTPTATTPAKDYLKSMTKLLRGDSGGSAPGGGPS